MWLSMKQSTSTWFIGIALALSLGVNVVNATTATEKKYPLLAKRLFIANPNDIIINFAPLRAQLREYINKQPEKIGVYFEYLPTGTSINVNGDEDFFRASLIKLPGIMRTYKLIEDGKILKTDVIEITPTDINPLFNSKEKLIPGSRRTVKELIELSLRESNNTAYQAIFTYTNNKILGATGNDEQNIRDIYDYLDIPRAENGETQFISPKNYSSVLKSLYFSSYLSYENSSEILKHLIESSFDDWLPEPLPENTLVAHKFGIYSLEKPVKAQVHSDCGIIYENKRPYELCVMVNSSDTKSSAKHIQTISKLVHGYVTTAFK